MWYTFGDPPFILPPNHAALFRLAAGYLSDTVGWETDDDLGAGEGSVFDGLTQGQKQAAILTVTRALLDPQTEAPLVTAALASTIDTIYGQLECILELDIDEKDTSTRQMILDALVEQLYWDDLNDASDPGDDEEKPLSVESEDKKEWFFYVEHLRTTVLEDYDFDMSRLFLDLPPEKAAELKERLNIDPEYFTAVVEDPPAEHFARMHAEMRALVS